jgi:hypothetical protein
MMEIRQCKFCHKNYQGFSNLCPQCLDTLDKIYVAVRNHLDSTPNSSVRQIVDATGIDERSILFLIREGRLMLRGVSSDIKCIKCGAPIALGKYCDACKSGIVQSLESTRHGMEKATTTNTSRTQQLAQGQDNLRGGKVELHTRHNKND